MLFSSRLNIFFKRVADAMNVKERTPRPKKERKGKRGRGALPLWTQRPARCRRSTPLPWELREATTPARRSREWRCALRCRTHFCRVTYQLSPHLATHRLPLLRVQGVPGYYVEERYCGIITILVGVFIFPFVCCCPCDSRRVFIPMVATPGVQMAMVGTGVTVLVLTVASDCLVCVRACVPSSVVE